MLHMNTLQEIYECDSAKSIASSSLTQTAYYPSGIYVHVHCRYPLHVHVHVYTI